MNWHRSYRTHCFLSWIKGAPPGVLCFQCLFLHYACDSKCGEGIVQGLGVLSCPNGHFLHTGFSSFICVPYTKPCLRYSHMLLSRGWLGGTRLSPPWCQYSFVRGCIQGGYDQVGLSSNTWRCSMGWKGSPQPPCLCCPCVAWSAMVVSLHPGSSVRKSRSRPKCLSMRAMMAR